MAKFTGYNENLKIQDANSSPIYDNLGIIAIFVVLFFICMLIIALKLHNKTNQDKQKSKKDLIKNIFLIITAFFMLFTPSIAVSLLKALTQSKIDIFMNPIFSLTLTSIFIFFLIWNLAKSSSYLYNSRVIIKVVTLITYLSLIVFSTAAIPVNILSTSDEKGNEYQWMNECLANTYNKETNIFYTRETNQYVTGFIGLHCKVATRYYPTLIPLFGIEFTDSLD